MSLAEQLAELILKSKHITIEGERNRLEIERVSRLLDKEIGERESTLIRVTAWYQAGKKTDGLWPT